MNIKKILSVVTSFFIFVNIVPFGTVSAEEENDLAVWDGTADTTWYDGEETELHIYTPSELAGLAVLGQEGRKIEGQTIILENDISLKDYNWIPIGGFGGIFDGNNHTIYGMNLISDLDSLSSNRDFGLFGDATKSTIQNLNLKDITINIEKEDSDFLTGGIAGYGGTVKDCTVSGTIDCKNTASSSYNIGGIVGAAYNVIRCKSNVTINAYSVGKSNVRIGGICGSMDEGEINECCNYGQITHDGEAEYCGISGIIGLLAVHSKTSYIKNCYNRADINSSLDTYGIVGRLMFFDTKYQNYEISNVYNTGKCDYGIYKSSDYAGKYSNMYYSSTSALKGTDNQNDLATPKPIDNMKIESFAESLGSSFVYQENDLPILKWEAKDMPIAVATTTTEVPTTMPTTTTSIKITTTQKAETTKNNTLASTTTKAAVTQATTTTKPEPTVMLRFEKALTKGEQYAIDAISSDLIYTSDNNDVATVSSSGIITAIGSGTTKISVMNAKYDVVEIIVTVSEATTTSVSSSAPVTETTSATKFGDVNNDDKIDASDATLLLAYYAKISTGYLESLEYYIGELTGINPLTNEIVEITSTSKPTTATTTTTTSTTTTTTTTTTITSTTTTTTTTKVTTTVTTMTSTTPINGTIYEGNGIVVKYKGITYDDGIKPEYDDILVKVYIENNNDRDICIQARDFSINGYMIDPIFSSEIAAGMKINDEITVNVSDLKKNGITDIIDIETKLNIFDWKDRTYNIKTKPVKIKTEYNINTRS